MKLSMQHKAYLLIAINILFIFSLFLWLSDIRVARTQEERTEVNLNPQKITITNHQDASVSYFEKDENGNWVLNLGKAKCHANEHALNAILFDLKKFFEGKPSTGNIVPLKNLSWEVKLTEKGDNFTKFEIYENGVRVTKSGKQAFISSENLCPIFFQNRGSFVDEKLLNGDLKEIRFLKLKIADTNFSFLKKNDSWFMDLPLVRPVDDAIVNEILRFLRDVHCNTVVDNQQSLSPVLTIITGVGNSQSKLDFFQRSEQFFLKKNDIVFEIPSEFKDGFEQILSNLLKLGILDGIVIDSIEIQTIPDEQTILLQKLETGDKWQASLRGAQFMNFSEIGHERILILKNFISKLSVQRRLYKVPDGRLVKYRLKIFSNLGVFVFQIFENGGQYTLFHDDSGYNFVVPHECVEILDDVIEACEQNYERNSSGSSD